MSQYGVWWGLASAIGFGSGDFSGGMASRRANPNAVAAGSGFLGLVLLLVVALVAGSAVPPATNLVLGVASGVFGGLGLAALYRAFSLGAMGLVAALASAGSVSLALVAGIVFGRTISGVQFVGFACAVLSAVLAGGVSRSAGLAAALRYGGLAALGFGGFLILVDRAATPEPWWILVASRSGATVALLGLILLRRESGTLQSLPHRPVLPLVALAGLLDSLGNLFFIIARGLIQVGLAAALSGLYPLVTMGLARVIAREHLPRGATPSVVLAVLGVVLISVG